jgi:hypothetical protein
MWPTEIGDHDGDGVPELMVKFNRTAVREMLSGYRQVGTGGRVGYYVTLTVSGSFYDGTNFSCSDEIRVLAIKKTGVPPSPFSNPYHGLMNMLGHVTAIRR